MFSFWSTPSISELPSLPVFAKSHESGRVRQAIRLPRPSARRQSRNCQEEAPQTIHSTVLLSECILQDTHWIYSYFIVATKVSRSSQEWSYIFLSILNPKLKLNISIVLEKNNESFPSFWRCVKWTARKYRDVMSYLFPHYFVLISFLLLSLTIAHDITTTFTNCLSNAINREKFHENEF